MDMNDDTPTHDELDDLAVYALDAHDPGNATAIESYLLAQPGAARWSRSSARPPAPTARPERPTTSRRPTSATGS